ncbi:hypothetical protein [Fredinandcohnia onubensis]|uniref:hypothetical protein n=1 Tax=Fredinandcohnia onubensis TaxID=1571209 RepID=UPI000C0BBF5E|nr:hypothetical protein [Fredinandcohnia onubensis]
MDQFDKEIKQDLHTYLKSEINIEPKEKQRLNERISRINTNKPRKVGYYAAIAGAIVLLLLLATPMLKDFEDNNKPGADNDKIIENHPDKDSDLNEKEVPIVEVNEEDEHVVDIEEEQENSPVDKTNEGPAFVPLNSDEAFAIIEGLITNVRDQFNQAGQKYGWGLERNFVEAEYAPFAKDLREFATDQFVQGHLFEIAKDYCYTGCDAGFFPNLFATVRHNLSVNTADKVTLSFLDTPNMLHDGFETTISLQKEGGTWKLASIENKRMELIDYQITREEADQLMSNYEGFTFIKEVKGVHDRLYWDSPQTTSTKPFDATIYIYYMPKNDTYFGIYSDDGSSLDDYMVKEYLK